MEKIDMTQDEEPEWRRLTSTEIEELRAEMRAAGEWCKAEMARRRSRIVELRCYGESIEDTARRVGCSEAIVKQVWENHLQK